VLAGVVVVATVAFVVREQRRTVRRLSEQVETAEAGASGEPAGEADRRRDGDGEA